MTSGVLIDISLKSAHVISIFLILQRKGQQSTLFICPFVFMFVKNNQFFNLGISSSQFGKSHWLLPMQDVTRLGH